MSGPRVDEAFPNIEDTVECNCSDCGVVLYDLTEIMEGMCSSCEKEKENGKKL